MPQPTFVPIQLYRSLTPAAVPLAANLTAGELAINYADGRLFYEDTGGSVQVIGAKMTSAVATFLGTPSSANLAAAVTDETGSGALVFGTSATIGGSWTSAATIAQSAPINFSGAASNEAQGSNIASASSINLDTATGNLVDVTGTTTIATITLSQGRERTVRFTGILTLTNSANLVLPGAADLVTDAGAFATFRGYAAGVVRLVSFQFGADQTQRKGPQLLAYAQSLAVPGGSQTITIPNPGLTGTGNWGNLRLTFACGVASGYVGLQLNSVNSGYETSNVMNTGAAVTAQANTALAAYMISDNTAAMDSLSGEILITKTGNDTQISGRVRGVNTLGVLRGLSIAGNDIGLGAVLSSLRFYAGTTATLGGAVALSNLTYSLTGQQTS